MFSLARGLSARKLKALFFADTHVFVVSPDLSSVLFANALAACLFSVKNKASLIKSFASHLNGVNIRDGNLWPRTIKITHDTEETELWTAHRVHLFSEADPYLMLKSEPVIDKPALKDQLAALVSTNLGCLPGGCLVCYDFSSSSPVFLGSSLGGSTDEMAVDYEQLGQTWQSVPETSSITDIEGLVYVKNLRLNDHPVGLVFGDLDLFPIGYRQEGDKGKEDKDKAVSRMADTATENKEAEEGANQEERELRDLASHETRIAAYLDPYGQILALSSPAKRLMGNDKLVFSDLTSKMIDPVTRTLLDESLVTLDAAPRSFRIAIEHPPARDAALFCLLALEGAVDLPLPEVENAGIRSLPLQAVDHGDRVIDSVSKEETEPESTDSPPVDEEPAKGVAPFRFTFRSDSEGRLCYLSDEFSSRYQDLAGLLTGQTLSQLLDYGEDALRDDLSHLLEERDAWSGLSFGADPGEGDALIIELCALPAYDKSGAFLGYSGFGLCRCLRGESSMVLVPLKGEQGPNSESADTDSFFTLSRQEEQNFLVLSEELKRGLENEHQLDTTAQIQNAGVSEKEQFFEVLRDNREELQAIFRNGELVEASQALLDLSGFSHVDELANAFWEQGLHPLHNDEEGGAPFFLLPNARNERLITRVHLRAMSFGEDAFSLMTFHPGQDQEQQAWLRQVMAVIDLTADGFLMLDKDDFIEAISPALARQLFWKPDDLKGRSVQSLLSWESVQDWQKALPAGEADGAPSRIIKLIDRLGFPHFFHATESYLNREADQEGKKVTERDHLLVLQKLSEDDFLTHLQRDVMRHLKDELSTTTALIDGISEEIALPLSRLISEAGELQLRLGKVDSSIQPLALSMVRSAMVLKKIVAHLDSLRHEDNLSLSQDISELSLAELTHQALEKVVPEAEAEGVELISDIQSGIPLIRLEKARVERFINQSMKIVRQRAQEQDRIVVVLKADEIAQILTFRLEKNHAPAGAPQAEETTGTEQKITLGEETQNITQIVKPSVSTLESIVPPMLVRAMAFALGASVRVNEGDKGDYSLSLSFPASRQNS